MKRCRQCGWPWDLDKTGLCKNCQELQRNPDPLSRQTSLKGIPFEDMKHMDEPHRIEMIVQCLSQNPGKKILVLVDTGEGHEDKGDRYVKQIREKLPSVKLVGRTPGPVPGCESLTFKL